MELVLSWISIASLMLIVLSLVDPAIALPWSKVKTRKKGVSIYGCTFLASLALSIVIYPATNLESRITWLLMLAIIPLIIGIISPGLVLPWSRNPTKLSVLMFYLPPVIFLAAGLHYATKSQPIDPRYDLPAAEVQSADPVRALRYAVANELRGENNIGLPRIRSIQVTPTDGVGYDVKVEYNINNSGLKSFFGVLSKMDMTKIYRAIYTSGRDVASASITAYYPVDDPMGKSPPVPVLTTTLDKKAADNIDWSLDRPELELETEILPELWTETYIHPDYK
ncbi:MAG: hypothetical protein KC473_10455 [Candidatus Dadabacteria bacterium]|nr:hypothetical protein [Candidatus Dadabacteria bacterium]